MEGRESAGIARRSIRAVRPKILQWPWMGATRLYTTVKLSVGSPNRRSSNYRRVAPAGIPVSPSFEGEVQRLLIHTVWDRIHDRGNIRADGRTCLVHFYETFYQMLGQRSTALTACFGGNIRDKSANLNRFVAMVREAPARIPPASTFHSWRGPAYDFGKKCFEQGVGMDEFGILEVVVLSALTALLQDNDDFQRQRDQILEAWETRLKVVVIQMLRGAETVRRRRQAGHRNFRTLSSLRERSSTNSFYLASTHLASTHQM